MARELAADVNTNGEESFTKFAEHVEGGETREFGSSTGVSTGIPGQIYNQIFVFEPPEWDDLAAAVDWIAERDVPFRVTVPATLVETVSGDAADLGLVEKDDTAPGMAMASSNEVPSNDSPATISEVTDSDGLEAFRDVFSAVFGLPPKFTRLAHPESMLADDDIRLFVGRVDGEAVACGQGVRTDDVVGVYSIGVEEGVRRQGIGEAMTWEVLGAGREAGCQVGTLQSTEMAYSLYQRMGFETVVEYHAFEPGD